VDVWPASCFAQSHDAPPPFVLAIAAGLAALARGALVLATFELDRRSAARATAKHLSSRAEQAEDRAACVL
jgi:hypothetical protein